MVLGFPLEQTVVGYRFGLPLFVASVSITSHSSPYATFLRAVVGATGGERVWRGRGDAGACSLYKHMTRHRRYGSLFSGGSVDRIESAVRLTKRKNSTHDLSVGIPAAG